VLGGVQVNWSLEYDRDLEATKEGISDLGHRAESNKSLQDPNWVADH
jgi:hypothetical protein